MKKIILLSIYALFLNQLLAQVPFPEPGAVFSDLAVPRIDLLIPTDSLNAILAPGNEESDYHYHATFIFDNGTEKDTLENIGFRLRGNTSRYSDKKSYKISFNTYEPGRKFHGLEKMNLNGEHNDPSIMRAKIAWDLTRQMEIPGSRSNHVRLFVNDVFFGIYLNVEHIDEEFIDLRFGNKSGNFYKCLWPANLEYLGANPDLYKLESGDRRAYELTTNTEADDYSDLAHFIDVLNNTPTDELACALEKIFDVKEYLKAMAFDVLIGNWDGPLYNKNNFYLYHNPTTGKFHYIPYDLDNTFGIDWFGIDWGSRNIYDWAKHGEPRPLYWNILAVQEYRELYTYYLTQFLESAYHTDSLFSRIDDLKSNINAYIPSDPFYPLDYGFSFSDFILSFTEALPYNHTDYGIKPFITTRRFWTAQQLDSEGIHPIIFSANNTFPLINEDIIITTKVADTNPISTVQVCYKKDNETEFTCLNLLDDGLLNDETVDDGIYTGSIPATGQAAHIEYYITARDEDDLESQFPTCGLKEIFIGGVSSPIYINEIMASNDTTIADEAGEYDDWLELYYTGNEPLYLGDKYLSDEENNPTQWRFGDQWMAPNSYQLVWLDKDEEQGDFHANFKLSAGGEFIGIFDNESHGFALINGFSFGEQTTDIAYGRIPNGTGSLDFITATPGYSNTPNAANQITTHTAINIYPNPVSHYLTISFTDKKNRAFHWSITDISGKLLLEQNNSTPTDTTIIPTDNLPAGIYFLTIVMKDGERVTRKFIRTTP